MNTTKVSDLTVDELLALIRLAVREALESRESGEKQSPLTIPTLDVGPWPERLQLLSREDYYGDDGR